MNHISKSQDSHFNRSPNLEVNLSKSSAIELRLIASKLEALANRLDPDSADAQSMRTQRIASNDSNLPANLAETYLGMAKFRTARERFFDADLFGEPVWDMLVDLMAARLQNRPISVSSLCIAARVPATTALRYIQIMADRGLVNRVADKSDARRVFIVLSDDAYARMKQLSQLKLLAE